jgi:hypothetical protein
MLFILRNSFENPKTHSNPLSLLNKEGTLPTSKLRHEDYPRSSTSTSSPHTPHVNRTWKMRIGAQLPRMAPFPDRPSTKQYPFALLRRVSLYILPNPPSQSTPSALGFVLLMLQLPGEQRNDVTSSGRRISQHVERSHGLFICALGPPIFRVGDKHGSEIPSTGSFCE